MVVVQLKPLLIIIFEGGELCLKSRFLYFL